MKQLRDLEAELEDERKQRAAALSVRKKLEADLKDMEQQLEINNKLKEDAVKQLKKLQVRLVKTSLRFVIILPLNKKFIVLSSFRHKPKKPSEKLKRRVHRGRN